VLYTSSSGVLVIQHQIIGIHIDLSTHFLTHAQAHPDLTETSSLSSMVRILLESNLSSTLSRHKRWPRAKVKTLPQHTATYYNTLQHTATHRNAPQRTATHRNALQCTATQHTALNTLQRTSKVVNSAYLVFSSPRWWFENDVLMVESVVQLSGDQAQIGSFQVQSWIISLCNAINTLTFEVSADAAASMVIKHSYFSGCPTVKKFLPTISICEHQDFIPLGPAFLTLSKKHFLRLLLVDFLRSGALESSPEVGLCATAVAVREDTTGWARTTLARFSGRDRTHLFGRLGAQLQQAWAFKGRGGLTPDEDSLRLGATRVLAAVEGLQR